jgi:hypothetical protein
MKTNKMIHYTVIKCDNIDIDILEKIITRIDFTFDKYDKDADEFGLVLEDILYGNIEKNDIKLYVLKFLLENKQKKIIMKYQNIIVTNIIKYGNLELLQTVKNYGMNIKGSDECPYVLYILGSKNQKMFLDFYKNENCYYNCNMLDEDYIMNAIDCYFCPYCIEFLIDNFDIFSKMFSSTVDIDNILLNNSLYYMCVSISQNWIYDHFKKPKDFSYKLILPTIKKIFNFLIKKRISNNINYTHLFKQVFTITDYYKNNQQEYLKVFLSCLVENNFIPDKETQKIINKYL